MARLSDREKTNMIADFVETGNYSAVARKYGVSRTTVKNIVSKEGQLAQRIEDQREENVQSVLRHMQKKTGKVCGILDDLLDVLSDRDKLAHASVKEIATAMGILIDKFAKPGEADDNNESLGIIIMPERKKEKINDSG